MYTIPLVNQASFHGAIGSLQLKKQRDMYLSWKPVSTDVKGLLKIYLDSEVAKVM